MTDLAKALAEVKSGIAYDDTLEIILNGVMSGELIPLADHKLAVALVVEKAAMPVRPIPTEHHCVRVPFYHDTGDIDQSSHLARSSAALADTILSLAPTDALAEVQALRAARDGLLRAAHDNHEADKRAEAAEAKLAATQAKLARLEALPPDFGHDGLRWKIGAAMLRNIDAASPQTDRTAALYHAFRAGLRAALEGAKP